MLKSLMSLMMARMILILMMNKVYTITIARNQSTFTFITNACLVIPGHLTKLVFVIWGEDIFLEIL